MKLFISSLILFISLGFVKLQDQEVIQLSKVLFSSKEFQHHFPQKIDTIYVYSNLKTDYKSFINNKKTVLLFYTKESLFVKNPQEWFEIKDLNSKKGKFYFNLFQRKSVDCKECRFSSFSVIIDKDFTVKKMKKYK